MRAITRCALMQCVKDNSFCVFYLTGLGAVIAFMTTLIFNTGLLGFGLIFAGLLLAGGWYMKACYVRNDGGRGARHSRETVQEEP